MIVEDVERVEVTKTDGKVITLSKTVRVEYHSSHRLGDQVPIKYYVITGYDDTENNDD